MSAFMLIQYVDLHAISLYQFGMSVTVSIALMFIFIPGISSSLFALWFYLDSQSMNRSGPGLYLFCIHGFRVVCAVIW